MLTWRSIIIAVSTVLFLYSFSSLCAQPVESFDTFLSSLDDAPIAEQTTAMGRFVSSQRARGGFPIATANGEALFVYFGSGEEREVRLTGDFAPRSFFDVYWDMTGQPMDRRGRVFYAKRIFEPDARLDYQFVVDGKPTRDPLNPRTILSGTGGGEVSVLAMPGHRLPPEADARPNVPKGQIQRIDESWASPAIRVYVPAGYCHRTFKCGQ
jgi:hypothetical protein